MPWQEAKQQSGQRNLAIVAITITAPADIEVSRPRLGRGDALEFSPARAAFAVGLLPKAAGERHITLDIRFAVCSEVACEPRHKSVALSLQVR